MPTRINKQQAATEIAVILNRLYPDPPIPLDSSSPFTLLIAVLLSAQCTDVRVNLITPRLFEIASKPESMMKLAVAEIEGIIRSCGLAPAKSKAIQGLSKILVERFDHQVPKTLEELETLPGDGHKTAQVVMAQAFGIPSFPVDTHIHRLAFRWKLSTGRNVVQTEKDLKRLFPVNSWNKLHLQIIYFGREYCPARGHHAKVCPICSRYGRKSLFG
ncbi:MAG: endonuclease III [Nitrospinaceae bacterium]|nr:endonuclease III [Nitrospinaceae bacterium]